MVVTPPQTAESARKAAPSLKKGFFDAPPKRKLKPPGEQKPTASAREEIPMIRAKQPHTGGPAIPDFLRVEPDEQERRYMAMKNELIEKLKPTPDMVSQIGQDPSLLACFDDPEVMAAVNDIAANPGSFKKYKDKPKVMAFYKAMGQLMGEKLEKVEQRKTEKA
ncbi:hypothetical protein GPECTOR_1g632 [Gonium pectorale]|uniref:STI1/HOP DP domain-containing protein n=1 Tax=Gonium pectorale TaxID=33097 RepID=A0A150H3T4_GONPE|nr:hypothetical protein GPECTOR_1g632 [Gonium pectorale]|eukprot:KXZ56702.1 hypothetical protein GPECTOR_1g632 [Gonium pectorale]